MPERNLQENGQNYHFWKLLSWNLNWKSSLWCCGWLIWVLLVTLADFFTISIIYVVRWAIWYYLFNLKNVKNTHGGVLMLVKFTKINTPPWVFFTFFELYKWYQIEQRTTYPCTFLHVLTILYFLTITIVYKFRLNLPAKWKVLLELFFLLDMSVRRYSYSSVRYLNDLYKTLIVYLYISVLVILYLYYWNLYQKPLWHKWKHPHFYRTFLMYTFVDVYFYN